jgi:cytochrome oxidase assembly protein ShyY1
MMNRSKFQQFLTLLLVLSLSAIFIALGQWQWNRAQVMKKPLVLDQKIYPLRDLVQVTGALPGNSVNHFVTATGHYLSEFRARNQIDSKEKLTEVSGAIFSVDNCSCAILVARSVWGEKLPAQSTSITLTGKLLPSQSDNRAPGGDGEISRLDSALLVSQSPLPLMPGFIAVTGEVSNGAEISAARIDFPFAKPRVAGFYWQHLSYVVIWWLMAVLVLGLPLYTRRIRKSESGE